MPRALLQRTALVLLLGLAGCPQTLPDPSTPFDQHAENGAQYIRSFRAMLAEEPGSERRAKISNEVMSLQLAFADDDFRARSMSRGLRVTLGALSLRSRSSEAGSGKISPRAMNALRHAAEQSAETGNEGVSQALYTLLRVHLGSTDPTEAATVDAHLKALAEWDKALTSGFHPVLSARALVVARVARATYEPSKEVLGEATRAVTTWIAEATRVQLEGLEDDESITEEVVLEVQRARTYGPLLLGALHLQHGSAGDAIRAIDTARVPISPVAAPLVEALDRLKATPSAEAWRRVYFLLEPLTHLAPRRGRDTFGPERELFRNAAITAGLIAQRGGARDPHMWMGLATALASRGLGDAAMLGLSDALEASDPATRAEIVNLITRLHVSEVESGDLRRAERMYILSSDLLRKGGSSLSEARSDFAELLRSAGQVATGLGQLSEARERLDEAKLLRRWPELEVQMGEFFLAKGDLVSSENHFESLLRRPVSPRLFAQCRFGLSLVEHERGRDARARALLVDLLAAPDVGRDPQTLLFRGRAWFRLGQLDRARTDLEQSAHLATTPTASLMAHQLLAVVYLEMKDLASYRSLLRETPDLPLDLRSNLFAWGALLTEAQGLSPEVEVARTVRISRSLGEFQRQVALWLQGEASFESLLPLAKGPDDLGYLHVLQWVRQRSRRAGPAALPELPRTPSPGVTLALDVRARASIPSRAVAKAHDEESQRRLSRSR